MKKVKYIIAALAACVTVGSFALTAPLTADAGMVDFTLLEEDFSSGKLDSARWYVNDNTGLTFEEDYKTYTITNGWSGTGLVSKAKFVSGATIEIDVKEADWKSFTTSLFFAFGTPSTEGNLAYTWESSVNKECLYLNYNTDGGVNAIRIASRDTALTDPVDGEGNPLKQDSIYQFFTVDALADEDNASRISDKTLRITYAVDGTYSLSMRDLDAEETEPFTVVAKSSGKKLRGFPEGHIAVYVMEAGVNGFARLDIRDMRMYKNVAAPDENLSDSDLVAEFGDDFHEDYVSYCHAGTGSLIDGVKESLAFGQRYATENPLFLFKNIYAADPSDKAESLANLKFTFSVKESVGDRRFGVLFGADTTSKGNLGDQDTSYLWFKKAASGYVMGFDTYKTADVATPVIGETPIPGTEKGLTELTVETVLGSRGTLKVYINGESVFVGTAEYAYGGYCGFLTDGTGSAKDNYMIVTLATVSLYNSYYDRPTNANVTTNFENDEFNTTFWNLSSQPYMSDFTNGTYTKDGKLYFDNVANDNKISTKYKYSNFDISFKLLDLRRDVVQSENGDKLYPVSAPFGVVFGTEFASMPFGTLENTCPNVYFESTPDASGVSIDPDTWNRTTYSTDLIITNVGSVKRITLPAKFDLWDVSKDGLVFDIKISVADDNLKVMLKYEFEETYTTVADITMNKGLSGHVYLWSTGNNYYEAPYSVGAQCGYCVFDDIVIKNTDDNGNVTEIPFTSNRPASIPTDYNYVNAYDPDEYAPTATTKGGCSGSATGSIWLLPLLGGLWLVRRKKQ
ncbi:MAG: hypothetical protein IJX87_03205 [Clostridia bacterium]|nr:hypothetical protein [Clostridia bacterium]